MTGFFGKLLRNIDVAIDLGTAKTAVYVRGEGVVFQQPTLITLAGSAGGRRRLNSQSVVAIGDYANQIRGKEPKGIDTIRPLQSGVIQHLDAAHLLLKEIARGLDIRTSLGRLNVLIGAPRRITDVERRAVREAASSLRARSVIVVEEPLAAAIGAGIDIGTKNASMVVDIGSGITEVVVLASGGVVSSESVRVGGDAISQALMRYLRRDCDLIVGEHTVEALKVKLSALDLMPGDFAKLSPPVEVKGLDVHSRMPTTRVVSRAAAGAAMAGPVGLIVGAIRKAFETANPAVAADLIGSGIVLTGGTALLQGLGRLVEDSLGVPVRVAHDPLGAMVRGAGLMLDEMPTICRALGRA